MTWNNIRVNAELKNLGFLAFKESFPSLNGKYTSRPLSSTMSGLTIVQYFPSTNCTRSSRYKVCLIGKHCSADACGLHRVASATSARGTETVSTLLYHLITESVLLKRIILQFHVSQTSNSLFRLKHWKLIRFLPQNDAFLTKWIFLNGDLFLKL